MRESWWNDLIEEIKRMLEEQHCKTATQVHDSIENCRVIGSKKTEQLKRAIMR